MTLPSAGLNGATHQRSASQHSTTSNASIPSLPYPLLSRVPPVISTRVPGLSNSQTSSPSSSAPFTQSPTLAWLSGTAEAGYGSRPGTSSSGIVAGMGNIDLNNIAGGMGAGVDGNQFPNGGGDIAFGYDGPAGNYSTQSFDPMSNNNFTSNMVNGFDSSNYEQNTNPDVDSFLAQLQQPLNQQNLGSYPNSIPDPSSAVSPNMDIEGLIATSFDPQSIPGYEQYQQQQLSYGSLGQDQTPESSTMQDFLKAQTSIPAPGFGLQPQSTPLPNLLQESSQPQPLYGLNNSSPNSQMSTQMLRFGKISNPRFGESNSSDQQPRLLRQQPTSYLAEDYGVTTSMFSPTSLKQETTYSAEPQTMDLSTLATESSTSPQYLSSSQTPPTAISSTEFGSILGEIPQQPLPSDNFSPLGLGSQMTEQPWRQMLYRAPAGGVGVEPFMDGARAGPQEDISYQSPTQEAQTRMRIVDGMAEDLGLGPSQSANSRVGSLLEEVGRGPSHFGKQVTPKPNLQQQRQQLRQETLRQPQYQAQKEQQGLQGLPTLFGSPSQKDQMTFEPQQLPQSQRQPSLQYLPSRRIFNHARSRSDTITPANAMEMTMSQPFENGDGAGIDSSPSIGSSDGDFSEKSSLDENEMAVSYRRSGQWGTLSPITRAMVVNPDPLEPFFKTVQERNLIRHYVQTSTNLMMALPSALNPILSVHLPIILSSAATAPITPPQPLASPPTSPDVSGQIAMAQMQQQNGLTSIFENNQSLHASIEALRLSLLGVAAIHQSYVLAKSGDENRETANRMWNLAANLRIMASKYLGVAVASIEGCRSDAALGACVSIALIDIFAGGYNYASNLDLGKTLVSLRGGPAAIVRYSIASVQGEGSSPTFEGPNHFVDSGSGSPPKVPNEQKTLKKGALISTGRLLLEILTVYDTFSTLTSGEQPALLRPGETAWWFEGDQNNYHLYSVENKFGMSRSIVELFARVSSFLNRHRHPPEKSSGIVTVEGNPTPNPSRPSTPTPSLSSLRGSPPPQGSPLMSLHAEACALLREVEAWNDGPIPVDQMHPRVKFGNYALKSALLILLLREAFNLGPNDPRVQKCAEMTLLAALKASADFEMSVDLTWPVIIAGCQCSGRSRALTVKALEGFRKQCCFEIDTSELIVSEVWRRLDAGLPRADFRSVVEDLSLKVLIL